MAFIVYKNLTSAKLGMTRSVNRRNIEEGEKAGEIVQKLRVLVLF